MGMGMGMGHPQITGLRFFYAIFAPVRNLRACVAACVESWNVETSQTVANYKPLHTAHKLITHEHTFLFITLQHKNHYEYTIRQI